jgi:hypothetical protein
MARNGVKSGGRDIKKGEVLNKKGSSYPNEIRRIDKWTQLTFRLRVQEFLNMTMDELKAKLKDSDTLCGDLLIGMVLMEAIKRGDVVKMNAILDRCIGKVTERMEIVDDKTFIVEKRNGDQIIMGRGDVPKDVTPIEGKK